MRTKSPLINNIVRHGPYPIIGNYDDFPDFMRISASRTPTYRNSSPHIIDNNLNDCRNAPRMPHIKAAGRKMVTRGLRRRLTSYGDQDFSLFLRKAFIKAMG